MYKSYYYTNATVVSPYNSARAGTLDGAEQRRLVRVPGLDTWVHLRPLAID